MKDLFDEELTAEQKAEFIQLLDSLQGKFDQMQEQAAKDREEIARTNAETRRLLDWLNKSGQPTADFTRIDQTKAQQKKERELDERELALLKRENDLLHRENQLLAERLRHRERLSQ